MPCVISITIPPRIPNIKKLWTSNFGKWGQKRHLNYTSKFYRQTDKQTDTRTNISNNRLNWPRGPIQWKSIFWMWSTVVTVFLNEALHLLGSRKKKLLAKLANISVIKAVQDSQIVILANIKSMSAKYGIHMLLRFSYWQILKGRQPNIRSTYSSDFTNFKHLKNISQI